MARKRGGGGAQYYYAGGEKVELTPDPELVAVHESDAPAGAGRALTDGLRLVAKSVLGKLKGPTYPVFKADGALVVALPEVRVEEGRAGIRAKLHKWLEKHGARVEVTSRDDDRVVLKPASGTGEDALALANDLAEKVGPEMAQTRFIRVVPQPDRTT